VVNTEEITRRLRMCGTPSGAASEAAAEQASTATIWYALPSHDPGDVHEHCHGFSVVAPQDRRQLADMLVTIPGSVNRLRLSSSQVELATPKPGDSVLRTRARRASRYAAARRARELNPDHIRGSR
jgi:hypothetical protein